MSNVSRKPKGTLCFTFEKSNMAFSGLEPIFRCSQPLKKKQDCLIAFIHWKLVKNNFLSLSDPSPINQVSPRPEQLESNSLSELLPQGWNEQPDDVYEIHYMKKGKIYLMKAISVDEQLIITIVRLEDEKDFSLTLDVDSCIDENYQSFQTAYRDRMALNTTVEQVFLPLLSDNAAAAPLPRTGYTPPPSYSPPHHPSQGSASAQPPQVDPFEVGRGDLDPFAGGIGGGMLMDPRHPSRYRPQVGIPGNLPPGAVPPGARFDPFGPPGIPDRGFPGRFGGPGRQPGPRGGFGDPDPDHLPPPGYDDSFI